MVESAVTFGRYNLFTYGHISTIIEILKEYKRINIGLIINDEKSRIQIDKNLKEFYKLADKNYTDKKLLLPVALREKFIMEGLKEFDHRLGKYISVVRIKRPEYFVEEFNAKFPKEMYDIVFPDSKNENNEFDILRNSYMSTILSRNIKFVNPKLTVHSSEIKEGMERYVPKNVLKLLHKYEREKKER